VIQINYVLLDAARMAEHLEIAQKLNGEYLCLFNDKDERYLKAVAPYLFTYKPKTDFAYWLQKEGWGNSWGLFINSRPDSEMLQRHFTRFKTVRTEDGTEPYFRFYDPRVLRIFLETCDVAQLKDFFGPVRIFICEDEDPSFAILFSFDGKKLITEKVAADIVNDLVVSDSKA
jgi:Domain of unknown function (DUF4123)